MSILHEALRKARHTNERAKSDIKPPELVAASPERANVRRWALPAALMSVAVVSAAIWMFFAAPPRRPANPPTSPGAETEPAAALKPVGESDSVAELNRAGTAALNRKDYPAAIAAFSGSLEKNPNQAAIGNNLGLALKKAGRFKEAEARYRLIIAGGAGDHRVFNNLAVLLEESGRWREAIDNYHEALRRLPDYADAELNLALLLEKKGRRDEALAYYRRFMEHADAGLAASVKAVGDHLRRLER